LAGCIFYPVAFYWVVALFLARLHFIGWLDLLPRCTFLLVAYFIGCWLDALLTGLYLLVASCSWLGHFLAGCIYCPVVFHWLVAFIGMLCYIWMVAFHWLIKFIARLYFLVRCILSADSIYWLVALLARLHLIG
jgi:hypothetical protein